MIARYQSLLARYDLAKQSKLASKGRLTALAAQSTHLIDAQRVLQEVARQTQAQLEYRISTLVTSALQSVYPTEQYNVKLEFVVKRGRTEAEINFVQDGEKINPLDASGGGVVAVAALALRIALWALNKDRVRNVLILDEPFVHVSPDLRPLAAQMLAELSYKLKLQMIVVTNLTEIPECADRVFRITKNRRVSTVVETTKGNEHGRCTATGNVPA